MNDNTLPIAREGLPFIGLFAFITLVFALLGWAFLTVLLLALTLFTVYFFRDPQRYSDAPADALLAPADGKIVFVGEVHEDRYLKDTAVKVSIFMSVFNVHVNRVPFSGLVETTYYNKGAFLNADLDKASLENEQAGIGLKTDTGKPILFVQVAGLIARRIVSYPKIGDKLERGLRYGLIRFGSRVDVYLPKGTDLQVRLGDRTTAGETILGTLK